MGPYNPSGIMSMDENIVDVTNLFEIAAKFIPQHDSCEATSY